MILPALLLTLDKYSSWRVGRVVPMIMNSSLINHNDPVLRALPFIQATAEVILHNYSKSLVFERGL